MSTAELKSNLINQISTITDKVKLKELLQLIRFQNDNSVYITTSDEKKAIEEARRQIKNNETISNESLLKR